jgi:hypothetical protein
MYTNDNKFSFRDVILQFLFVALFIFILLWLFPTKNYVKDVKSELLENTGDSSDQTSTLVTSAIFNQNITTMKEAAILYFTTPRLPEKTGDKVTLTLKEMLNEHLLVSPLDEQGNVCDTEKSYIEITKNNDEYVLKVNLKCGSEEEYIDVHLGCYDYCQGAVCEAKDTTTQATTKTTTKTATKTTTKTTVKTTTPTTLSYQYEYKLNGKWSNWSNWSNWSTEKVTSSTSKEVQSEDRTTEGKTETIAATETVTYTCPTGYTQSATDKTKCIKSSEEIVTATVKKVYSCPSGFTYSGGMCKKGYVSTVDVIKEYKYTCPSGYTISGDVCYKKTTTTIDATKTIKYSCEDGYTISGTSCVRTVTTVTRQTFTSPRSGSNYKLVSTDTRSACTGCAYITYYTYDVTTTSTASKAATSSVSYSCSSGYTLAGTKCVKTSDTTTAASKTLVKTYCPDGYEIDSSNTSRCKKTVITEVDPDTNITYSCKDGYNLVEGRCVKGTVDTKDATKNAKYSCPSSDYTLNETAKSCTKTTVGVTTKYYRYRTRTYTPGDTQWRDTKTDKTLLSKGYYLTGNKRVKTSK